VKDEIRRIIKLVEEGKLSATDAADLIDAFNEADRATAEDQPHAAETRETGAGPEAASGGEPEAESEEGSAGTGSGGSGDPFQSMIEAMERLGKEASESVNWPEVARQVRESAKRGAEQLRQGIEEVTKGRVSFSTFFGGQESREVTLPLSIPEGKTLRIDNANGDIKVLGGFDSGTVMARARFRGGSVEELREKAEAYTPIVEESDHQVVLKQPNVSGLVVDLEVQVPSGTAVDIRAEHGDVSVLDTNGPAKATVRSGDLRLRAVKGPVDLDVQRGDVSVEESETPLLTIDCSGGDISIRQVRGDINAKTSRGDVTLRDTSGRVQSIECASGDIRLEMSEPVSGNVNLRAVQGDASVAIPDGSDCRVSLATLRGATHCSLDLQDENRSAQRVTGRLGAGTGSLDVTTVSGDVRLEMRNFAEV
jgi:hypothetical protein